MLRKQEGCKMLSSNSLILHLKLDFASRLHSATSESSTPILYDSVAQLKDITLLLVCPLLLPLWVWECCGIVIKV